MICEQCGKEHDGTFGSGRFCCRSCSNKWVALHQSDEAKSKKVEAGKSNLKHVGRDFSREDRIKGGHESARVKSIRRKEWLDEILFTEGDSDVYMGGYTRFRDYLVKFGYKEYRCERCGLTEWYGQYISLELHHIDGNTHNNVLTNLELLCPNCHSLTPNYKWRKVNTRVH